MQKHDIIKKRINSHGDVIESRQDGIGAPKVVKRKFSSPSCSRAFVALLGFERWFPFCKQLLMRPTQTMHLIEMTYEI